MSFLQKLKRLFKRENKDSNNNPSINTNKSTEDVAPNKVSSLQQETLPPNHNTLTGVEGFTWSEPDSHPPSPQQYPYGCRGKLHFFLNPFRVLPGANPTATLNPLNTTLTGVGGKGAEGAARAALVHVLYCYS